jgi:class 3 adenylate cyclase
LFILGFLRESRKLPPLSAFPLSPYLVDFSLDRLTLGVDNVRHDVLLSPVFVAATRRIVTGLIERHAGLDHVKNGKRAVKVNWVKEVDGYKGLYKEMMQNALNQAKGQREIQIQNLVQAAVLKMLLEEIKTQFDLLIGRLKKNARTSDLAIHNDPAEAPILKEKVQRIGQAREEIRQRVGLEICSLWCEVEKVDLTTMREAIFGRSTPYFTILLANPLPHVEQSENEMFMLAEYDLALGRRVEDPDKYDRLLYYVRRLFNYVDMQDPANHTAVSVEQRNGLPTLGEEPVPREEQETYIRKIEGWIQQPGNIELLFNWQQVRAELLELRKQKAPSERTVPLVQRIKAQQDLLAFFYRQFCRNGLMDRITAVYEMQPEYLEYCPPLTPHQIAQYLLAPRSRRALKGRLKRMRSLYGRKLSLSPLNRKIKSLEQMTTAKRKVYLVRFLSAFARYHRDRRNCELLHDAMERINVAVDEKIIALSRENNTLYEFLLSHERAAEKTPIINHVVIKADVRGSTDITFRMSERNLNPASYFSLNFFDPISEILADYDAHKVFIEGDAVILAIFEHENAPGDWYSAARACGVALNMLVIIQAINAKNMKNQLPILELGIGISQSKRPPAFLFDGGQRIMISPAINHADRLSSCSKPGRLLFADNKSPFNLFVFQFLSNEEPVGTADDLLTRYNVNGIELSSEGFAKLREEIDLQSMEGVLPESAARKFNLYTGKFPTRSGRYQRLVIREAQIPIVDPNTLATTQFSARHYYEVCTHPRLYKLARQMG